MSNSVWKVVNYDEIIKDAKQNKSEYLEEWKSIPWNKIYKGIFDLQCDIASAEIDGENQKARNLQRILLAKDSLLLVAIKEVTIENRGSRTPGIDGMIY